MATCAMDLLYPSCMAHTSLVTTILWVSAATSKCYEADYVQGCTMPDPQANPDLFPVFLGVTNRTGSGLRREAVVDGNVEAVPPNATTVYANASGGTYHLAAPGSTLTGASSAIVADTVVVSAPGVTIRDIEIRNLSFVTGVNFGGLTVKNTAIHQTTSISPSAKQHVVDLNGARFDNLTGAAIAFFRHTGVVTCAGEFTRCFVLPKNDPGDDPGIVVATGGAHVVNVSTITGIFGEAYLVSFFAFNKEEETIEATELAQSLAWPTVAAIVSVLLAHGTPKKARKVEG